MSFTPEELELIEVLKKYGSRSNLSKRNAGLYSRLYKTRPDVLEEALPSLKKNWTKEACIADAKKYSKQVEWAENSSAIQAARKHGWI